MPLEALKRHSNGTQQAPNQHSNGTHAAEDKQIKSKPANSTCTPLVFIIRECYLCLMFHALSGVDHFFKNLKFIAISAKSQNG